MSDYEQDEGYIRYRYRGLSGTTNAKARYFSLAPVLPLGHFELTVGTSPVALPTIPPLARRVVIQSLGQDLTYTDDGTPPSATHGIVIPKTIPFIYDTDPDANFKMWCPAASDTRIAYYG